MRFRQWACTLGLASSVFLTTCSKGPSTGLGYTSQWQGIWQGTTGQNVPISFLVDQEGTMSIALSIRVRGTCDTQMTLLRRSGIYYGDGSFFSAFYELSSSSHIARDSLWGKFQGSTASGGYVRFDGVCGDTFNTAWTATRVSTSWFSISGTWNGTVSGLSPAPQACTLSLTPQFEDFTGTLTTGAGKSMTVYVRQGATQISVDLSLRDSVCSQMVTGSGRCSADSLSFVFPIPPCKGTTGNGSAVFSR
jgi:hypothetical protein